MIGFKSISCFVFCWVVAGCSVTSTGGNDGRTEHHFGYVRIHQPLTDQRLTTSRVTTIGMNLNPGLTLGYRQFEVIANPLRDESGQPACSLTIIIRDRTEAPFVEDVLNQLKGNEICIAHF